MVPTLAFISAPLFNDTVKTFNFTPNSTLHVGTHPITITLTDPHGASTTYTLTLNVYDYPRFSPAITSQILLHISTNLTYTLPVGSDPFGLTLTSTSMPAFGKIANTYDFNFLPTLASHVGVFTVDGVVSNPYLSTKYSFIVKVINDPPFFD